MTKRIAEGGFGMITSTITIYKNGNDLRHRDTFDLYDDIMCLGNKGEKVFILELLNNEETLCVLYNGMIGYIHAYSSSRIGPYRSRDFGIRWSKMS